MFVLRKMMKQREAIIFIAMIVLSFVASSVTPYMNERRNTCEWRFFRGTFKSISASDCSNAEVEKP